MTTVIEIDGSKCQRCYSCVRQCPARAIKVEDNQAKVVAGKCINCGYCIDVCTRDARETRSYRISVKNWSKKDDDLVACLAPSFIASFTDSSPGQVVAGLRKLGFDQVYRVSLGAKLVAKEYDEYLAGLEEKNLIGTSCPTIINFIEKHHPELLPSLIPIVSPMVAIGRLIKLENPTAKVVFIGPCIAKKAEIEDEEVAESIDAVLTFREIKEMCREEGLKFNNLRASQFDQDYLPHSDNFPLSGGLTVNLNNISQDQVLVTEGSKNCQELISGLLAQEIDESLLDILFCHGCIDGPRIDSELTLFARERLVEDYFELNQEEQSVSGEKEILEKLVDLDLSRGFKDLHLELEDPTEEEIKEILTYTNKITPGDELNCGACGYDTCREKAVAVYQGLAEIEMCLPYLLDQVQEEADYYRGELSKNEQTRYNFRDIKGKSVEIKEAKVKAQQAAQTESTILILGESGTGKEMFAHAIHNASLRNGGPFVKVNCAAITESLLESELFGYEEGAFTGAKKGGKEGKFELADQGTIFLDEVGDMSMRMQAKFLRVLQEKEIERVGGNQTINVDIRVVAATNRNLKQMVKDGEFRDDLYYRLNVITINSPPLREKIEDLPIIVEHIITKLTSEQRLPKKNLSQETLNCLMRYDWPGNVRELENTIMQTFSLTYDDIIEPRHLPNYILQDESGIHSLVAGEEAQSLSDLTNEVEREAIRRVLESTNWNKKRTAEILDISRSTLYQKIDKYNI